MTAPVPHPVAEGLAELAAARPVEELLRLFTAEGQQTLIVAALVAFDRKIHNLEVQMSQARDAIAELNTETNSLAGRIDALLAREGAFDSEVAGELRQVSARLRGLAADPANPVPVEGDQPADAAPQDQAVESQPASAGTTDVVNPTPGSSDQQDG